MKLLKKSDSLTMPWKNGLGSTAQIALYPPSADFASGDFLWRISSATVQSAGPFSQFPGFDRWLVVLSGEGLLLNGFPLLPLSPFHFSGDELIHSDLLNDPVTDLGIIYRRDRVHASMMLHDLQGPQTLTLTSGSHFLFCVQGPLMAENFNLESGDTLAIIAPKTLELKASGASPTKYLHLKLNEF